LVLGFGRSLAEALQESLDHNRTIGGFGLGANKKMLVKHFSQRKVRGCIS
jgi:hypothetical protein